MQNQLKELTIEITKECPLKCQICSSNAGYKDKNELSIEELKTLVDQSVDLGLESISLSGGEPLVSENCMPLINYIEKKGLHIDLYSSGNIYGSTSISSIPREIGKQLIDKVNRIIFSIHGSNSEIHDSITNSPGSFDNLMKSIELIKELKIPMELHFVPTALNYKSLPELIELVKEIEINKISILRFVTQGRGEDNKEILEISDDEIIEFRELLFNLKSDNKDMIRFGSPFNCFILNGTHPCTAGLDKATVRTDGLVFPCVSMKQHFEEYDHNSLHEYSMKDIWTKSDLFLFVRKMINNIPDSCQQCNNYSHCGAGCLTQRIINHKEKDPYCLLNLQLLREANFDIVEGEIINAGASTKN